MLYPKAPTPVWRVCERKAARPAVWAAVWAAVSAAAGAALLASALPAAAKPQADPRLGLGLAELLAAPAPRTQALAASGTPATAAPLAGRTGLAVRDAQGRVQVEIFLSGQHPMASVLAELTRLGARVLGHEAGYRHGQVSAQLPLAALQAVAALPGVRSLSLSPAPQSRSGPALTQGLAVLKADAAQALGFNGAGITVAVLSDSYDRAASARTRAAADVAAGELPGTTNPHGWTDPVRVLADASGADEGRAMLQIVHDLAPAARLCFATAMEGQTGFAKRIRQLASTTDGCGAQVIVDDIYYHAEPMFSDGVIAQAVDAVAAQGVSYFASAGNRGATQGYQASFTPLADAAARASGQSVNLALIDPTSSAGGFHQLNPGASVPDVARSVTLTGTSTLVLQWNDPFNHDAISADYDLHVFSADGQTLVASASDDNAGTDQPLELLQLPAGSYQIVISRSDADPGAVNTSGATLLRLVTYGTVVDGEYLDYFTPITHGHSAAAGAFSVAAVPFYQPSLPEANTSPGPVSIHFNASGQRLASPLLRQKPDFAAPDGVNTSFYGSDSTEDSDTLPNFFGTSAAAPHAAGVAALMLQAAGGPGHLSPAQVGQLLRNSAAAHDLQPHQALAEVAVGSATVRLSATGDGQSRASFDPNVFQLSLQGPPGTWLARLSLDIGKANAQRQRLGVAAPGLQFDPRATLVGYPLTLGRLVHLQPAHVTFSALASAAPFSRSLTLRFKAGKFGPGSQLGFGIDRDEVASQSGGNSADQLEGTVLRGVLHDPSGQTLTFSARLGSARGKGYSPLTGWGLVNAQTAVKAAQKLATP